MKRDFWHIWTIPLGLGAVSLVGLLSALLGDDLLDVISWISLIIPLLVIGWFVAKPRSGKRRFPNNSPGR